MGDYYSDVIEKNPVLRKIFELASKKRFGHDSIAITDVKRRKTSDGKNVWDLYQNKGDSDPIDTVEYEGEVDWHRITEIEADVMSHLASSRPGGAPPS